MDAAEMQTLCRAQAALEKANGLLRALRMFDGIDAKVYGLALDARLEVCSAIGALNYYTKRDAA